MNVADLVASGLAVEADCGEAMALAEDDQQERAARRASADELFAVSEFVGRIGLEAVLLALDAASDSALAVHDGELPEPELAKLRRFRAGIVECCLAVQS